MDELTPAARALIDLARDGHDATPAQRTRADAAVRIGLALHGITDLPPLAPPVHAPYPAAPPTLYPPQPAPQVASGALPKLSLTGSWKLAAAGSALLFAGVFAARSAHPLQDVAQPPRPASTAPAAVPTGAIGEAAPALAAAVTAASSPQAATALRRDGHALSGRSSALAAARSTPARASRSQVAASGVSDADLQAEVALIGAADELIRAQRYDGALRVLASHAQRFPRGALREEREALRLLALCGHGLDARSERAVQRFLRTEPHSVVAQRMREACEPSASP
jgi:hypothetical protein